MSHRQEWTDEDIELLGKFTDAEVGKRTGRTSKQVCKKRTWLGITACHGGRRPKRQWTPDEDALLGTLKDSKVGEMLGIDRQTVAKRRNIFDIPPFGRKSRVGEKKAARGSMHRGVRVSWFTPYKHGAATRGIEYDVTIDDVADVYEAQGGRCALSRRDLPMEATGTIWEIRASIDRIDSSVGYVVGNIQIVDKEVNMCKQSLSQDEFIKMCREVGNAHPE
jgi:hypothetical protein